MSTYDKYESGEKYDWDNANGILNYKCECGKTFKWKKKGWRSSKWSHHKSQTHIKLVDEKRKKYEIDAPNAFSVLPNPLLNIKMPPSRE